jgi:hypothetical protein
MIIPSFLPTSIPTGTFAGRPERIENPKSPYLLSHPPQPEPNTLRKKWVLGGRSFSPGNRFALLAGVLTPQATASAPCPALRFVRPLRPRNWNVMRLIALLVILFFSGCQHSSAPTSSATSSAPSPSAPAPPSGAPAFRSPTATEVFDLRSKCAERGERILKNAVAADALKKDQVSRYDPKTNRCYVQLTIGNPNATGEENFERSLLDGQTGQVLATIRRQKGTRSGIVYIDPSPLNGNSDELYLDASMFIDEMMVDDRQQ